MAVGQLRQPFGLTRDAYERFNLVIPGCQIGVADRPVRAMAIALVRAEIIVRPAIALTPPRQRTPSKLVRAEPREIGVRVGFVRILAIVDEVAFGEFREMPVLALHRVFAGIERGIAEAAERQFPRRLGFSVIIDLMLDLASALDHQNLEPGLGQFLGGPASGNARTHHDRVKLVLHHPNSTAVQSLDHARAPGVSGMSLSKRPGTSS